ncbi:MAG: hypothetical protein A2X49_08030 [Lentisphaerae bacterium GWF2_52_8]|nr:MAG: hypothetical protein A2X49_08030 [Lentisphaerae bacterium GWF2_52_8]
MKKMIVVLSVVSMFMGIAAFAADEAAVKELKGKVTKDGDKIVLVAGDKKIELAADKAALVGKEVVYTLDKDGKVADVKEVKKEEKKAEAAE